MTERATGTQIQYLQEKYNLHVVDIDCENSKVALRRKNGKELKASTVCRMLGWAIDNNAVSQARKWVEVKF